MPKKAFELSAAFQKVIADHGIRVSKKIIREVKDKTVTLPLFKKAAKLAEKAKAKKLTVGHIKLARLGTTEKEKKAEKKEKKKEKKEGKAVVVAGKVTKVKVTKTPKALENLIKIPKFVLNNQKRLIKGLSEKNKDAEKEKERLRKLAESLTRGLNNKPTPKTDEAQMKREIMSAYTRLQMHVIGKRLTKAAEAIKKTPAKTVTSGLLLQ